MDELFEFSVRDIKLIDFCSILLGCSDFLEGFVEYAEQHTGEELTDMVLAQICEALTDFGNKRAAFNEYVEGRVREMMRMPEIQEFIYKRMFKTNTTKS